MINLVQKIKIKWLLFYYSLLGLMRFLMVQNPSNHLGMEFLVFGQEYRELADQELALRQSPADGPKLLGLTFHRLALDSYRAVRSKLELELTTRAEELDVTVRGDPFG